MTYHIWETGQKTMIIATDCQPDSLDRIYIEISNIIVKIGNHTKLSSFSANKNSGIE